MQSLFLNATFVRPLLLWSSSPLFPVGLQIHERLELADFRLPQQHHFCGQDQLKLRLVQFRLKDDARFVRAIFEAILISAMYNLFGSTLLPPVEHVRFPPKELTEAPRLVCWRHGAGLGAEGQPARGAERGRGGRDKGKAALDADRGGRRGQAGTVDEGPLAEDHVSGRKGPRRYKVSESGGSRIY